MDVDPPLDTSASSTLHAPGHATDDAILDSVITAPVRVGAEFQATVPDKPLDNYPADEKRGGRCVWNPAQIDPAKVEEFLDGARTLFQQEEERGESSVRLCEERALYFLHQMKYNTNSALDILRPVAAPEEEKQEEGDNEEGTEEGDDYCFVCGDGGNLLLCDYSGCLRAYHFRCVNLDTTPSGRWECPRHACKICKSDLSETHPFRCAHCPVSYCSEHVPAELMQRHERDKGDDHYEFLCLECYAKAVKRFGPSNKIIREKTFLKRLVVLLRALGVALERVPFVAGQELNLYSLYKEVTRNGGIHAVIANSLWKPIREALNIAGDDSKTNYLLKQHYMEYLYPYEQKYFSRTRPSDDSKSAAPSAGPAPSPSPVSASGGNTKYRSASEALDASTVTEEDAVTAASGPALSVASSSNAAAPSQSPSPTGKERSRKRVRGATASAEEVVAE